MNPVWRVEVGSYSLKVWLVHASPGGVGWLIARGGLSIGKRPVVDTGQLSVWIG